MEGSNSIQNENIENTIAEDTESLLSDSDKTNNICNPKSGVYRFLALFLMCFLGFGSYFCYDNPAALQDYFMSDLGLSTSQFVYLYSWYSWPNVVLCFVGGFLMDRVFGIRLGTVIFAVFVVIGQLIFALGGILNLLWLMVLGRFIFGIGGESLAVAQNSYAVLWFKGKELNMVFGLQLSFARVGSAVNFNLMEPIYKWMSHYYPDYRCTGVVLFVASATCFLSLICALALGYMDKRAEKILKRKPPQEGEVARITDVKDFPVLFWMVTAVVISYYVAIFPFIALGKVFFIRKFGLLPSVANTVNSMVYFISTGASPLLGYFIDKVGKNVFSVIVSIMVSVGAFMLLAFTFINPFVSMSILGVAYSMLASALWPMIALVIPEYQLGTAYGIAQAIQNLGLAVIPLLAGIIVDSYGYILLLIFFIGWLCLSLVVAIGIYLYDANSSGILNMTPRQREVYERNRLAAEDLEHDKLLASGSMSDVTPQDLLQPHSDFHIRNRYLSRIGAALPTHYSGSSKSFMYRPLR